MKHKKVMRQFSLIILYTESHHYLHFIDYDINEETYLKTQLIKQLTFYNMPNNNPTPSTSYYQVFHYPAPILPYTNASYKNMSQNKSSSVIINLL